MKEADIIKSLKVVAKEKVDIDEDAKNTMIAGLLTREIPVRSRGSSIDFLLSQIGFVSKIVWFWQGIWMLLFLYAVWNGNMFQLTNEQLCILSMAPPLLLLLTVEEVSKVYNRSMLEIEYATKYSLKKVVLVRMLILSIVNAILLLGGILLAGNRLELVLLEVLVYGLTPLLLMTCLLLKLMTKLQGEQLHYAGISLYLGFLLIVIVGRMERFHIYSSHLFGVWMILFVFGLLGVVYQGCKLGKHLESFEILAG